MLRNKSFVFMMIGEVVGGIGLWLAIIANLQFLQSLLSSDFLKSLVLMSGIFVSVLLLPSIGKIVDRYDKKKVLITANLIRCISPLLMFPALMYQSIPWMILSLILLQISNATYFPAVRTTFSTLIAREDLLAANTFHMNAITISRIAGTAIAGAMVSVMSLYTIYSLSLVVYLLLLGIFIFIHIPKIDAAVQKTKEKLKFTEVFTIIKQDRSIFLGIINSSVIALFLGGMNLFILSLSEIQHDPGLMGYLYAVEGTTILVVGLFVRRVIGKANIILATSFLLCVIAIGQYTMSFVDHRWTVLLGFGIFGSMVAFFFPMVTTIFQNRVPQQTQGRFFAFKEIVDRILMQVSILATGASLDLFGTSTYLIMIAGLTLLTALFTLSQTLRHKLDVRQYAAREQG
ncbi:MFS transporter [Paenibacillus albiflavus]|uniref:MFS transporter n=1 Tax=Paenibacillus albiflavus TaxID=2545760 RepID=A0A4R4EEB6_9BACL|nr:MFS transporter [Paenibacillus albiflavus]TCZ77420.1 MFS transporter [Paenibacillus albiflavus]